MQARLSRDPYEALGLTGQANHDQVRTAFLQLTKQFHPAKFARLAVDVQKLANEVFLALRGAHDTLAKPSVTPRQQTGQVPVLRGMPPSRPSSPPSNVSASGARPAVAHAPTQPVPTVANAPTQPISTLRGAPVGPSAPVRPTPSPFSRTPLPAAQQTQPMRPAPRAGTGVPDDPARSRLAQASNPPQAAPAATTTRPVARPAAPVATGRAPTKPTNPPVTPAAAAAAANTDPKLTSIYSLIVKNQYESARMLLEDLVNEKPLPPYKALLHFAKGKEAQSANRLDDARVDFMEAMQIVPEHPLAKSALVEMMTRRK